MTTPDERLARLEEQVRGVREDVSELVGEMNRTRNRLHQLEGVSQMFVETQKDNRRKEADQYRRLGLNIKLVGLLLTAAAVLSPIIVALLVGK